MGEFENRDPRLLYQQYADLDSNSLRGMIIETKENPEQQRIALRAILVKGGVDSEEFLDKIDEAVIDGLSPEDKNKVLHELEDKRLFLGGEPEKSKKDSADVIIQRAEMIKQQTPKRFELMPEAEKEELTRHTQRIIDLLKNQ